MRTDPEEAAITPSRTNGRSRLDRMATTEVIDLLLAGLDEAFERKAWHGATMWGTLRTVGREEAAWRPTPDRHNIWEIAVHCAYWKYIVRRRLTCDCRRDFPLEGSAWFVRPDGAGSTDAVAGAPSGTDADWKRERALLREEHEKLRAVVAAMSKGDLEAAAGDRDAVREIRGIANHDIYHTGQIRLLRILRPEA